MGFMLFFHENIKFMNSELYDLAEMMSSETSKGLHHTYISAILLVLTVISEIGNIDAFFCCRTSSILGIRGR